MFQLESWIYFVIRAREGKYLIYKFISSSNNVLKLF